ncbi:MAG: class I SAM-dependent methyltransferase [Treponemataceae bacterium]|nr:class I SAM-dependent methyltransferase [Treponemataceae bacterium]
MNCPICAHPHSTFISLPRQRKRIRRFFRCTVCHVVWEDPSTWLSETEEQERYLLHRNYPQDPGYRNYIERILKQIGEGMGHDVREVFGSCPLSILDYGCGPTPLVAQLLSSTRHKVMSYDPYFAPAKLQGPYDLILCIEVAEHFKEPRHEFTYLTSLLKEGGFLAIHTQLVPDKDEDFSAWWYKEDTTHRVFYSHAAMNILSSYLGILRVNQSGENLWLFQRPYTS